MQAPRLTTIPALSTPNPAHLVFHEALDDVEAGLGDQIALPPPVAGLQPRSVFWPQRHGLLRRRRRAQRPDAGHLLGNDLESQLQRLHPITLAQDS